MFIPLSGTDRADAKFPVAGANKPTSKPCQHTINTKPAKIKFNRKCDKKRKGRAHKYPRKPYWAVRIYPKTFAQLEAPKQATFTFAYMHQAVVEVQI